MAEFYGDDQNALWVDELESLNLTDLSDDSLLVDEDEVPAPEILLVEEDLDEADESHDSRVPGSTVEFQEDEEDKPGDWSNDGNHAAFIDYVKDKLQKIPKHSGETISGCERAKAFLKRIDNEISKAMRTDFDGLIDEAEVEQLRKSINDMMDRLEKQIKKLKSNGKTAEKQVSLISEGTCKKCECHAPMWHDIDNNKVVCLHCEADAAPRDKIEKTAHTPVLHVYMDAFQRACVGIMINAKVSGGKNIEETFMKLKNKYDFSPREEMGLIQLLADHGYPVFKDRGLLNEPTDPTSGDHVEWQTQYYA